MNPQARKIWDAVNPAITTSCNLINEPPMTRENLVLAHLACALGSRVSYAPSPEEALRVFQGSHRIILLPQAQPGDIREITHPQLPRKYLAMNPVMLAVLVGRAASALKTGAQGGASALIADLKLAKPVKA